MLDDGIAITIVYMYLIVVMPSARTVRNFDFGLVVDLCLQVCG